MTPFEEVLQHFKFPDEIVPGEPFVPHPDQVRDINTLAPLPNQGHWEGMGTGKTFIATACALYRRIRFGEQCVIILPPVLALQWERWLKRLRPCPTVTIYATPKRTKSKLVQQLSPAEERAKLSLDSDFVIVGWQIFKKDFDRFQQHFADKKVFVILDEATFCANIGSGVHEAVFEFSTNRARAPLSGTPINNPADGYGLLKFSAPGCYRNKKHFENSHVDERDYFDRPSKWKDLDILEANVAKNSFRLLYEDMYAGVQNPLYDLIPYSLSPAHAKLYDKLANEQLLILEGGVKLDATTVTRLLHALGQIVLNAEYFSAGEIKDSAGFELIEQKLGELGRRKLVVFANYRMTIASMTKRFKKFGCVPFNSEVTPAQKDKNLRRFIEDPDCRLIAIQFASGGKGLDGLQHVCHHMMFIEQCQQPRDFLQAVARLQRTGQRNRVWVGLPTAQSTLQPRAVRALVKNDDLINEIIRMPYKLRDVIFGKD